MPGTDSPALRFLIGHLKDHPLFRVRSWTWTGRFDNGEEHEIPGYRIHRNGTTDDEDRWLADVEGEVMCFRSDGVTPLCASSASGRRALDAFKLHMGPTAFLGVVA